MSAPGKKQDSSRFRSLVILHFTELALRHIQDQTELNCGRHNPGCAACTMSSVKLLVVLRKQLLSSPQGRALTFPYSTPTHAGTAPAPLGVPTLQPVLLSWDQISLGRNRGPLSGRRQTPKDVLKGQFIITASDFSSSSCLTLTKQPTPDTLPSMDSSQDISAVKLPRG